MAAVVEGDTADCEQSLAAVKLKEEQLSRLQTRVLQLKQSLTELVEKKKALSQVGTQVLQVRSRVRLLRQAHTESKKALCKELGELEQLKRSNYRREERLKKVRSKDLRRKEEKVEEEYAESRAVARRWAEELVSLRKAFLSHAHSLLFPMEVEPLSYQDAGEEDYTESSQIDCDTSLEVDGGWLLSGQHKSPTPHIRILSASLPSNGDYSLYIEAAKERRKAYKVTARMEVAPPPSSRPPPTSDPYLTVPAALVYTAQFVALIAATIDQPLPYPLPLNTAISEYGNPDRRKRDFLDSVAKLDDNITYLCFSQHVPLSAMTPGHTLENLLALVTHTQLGRGGAFECHPELTRYSGTPPLSHDSDNEPPSISYTADQSHYSSHDDTSESEDESSPPSTSTDIDGDWESVELLTPSERLGLRVGSLGGEVGTDLESSHSHRVRERLRHLDYNSTYQDYAALSSSEKTATSVLSAVDSVAVMGTLREGEKGEESEGSGGGSEGGSGWLGTLSSLWSSALRRTS